MAKILARKIFNGIEYRVYSKSGYFKSGRSGSDYHLHIAVWKYFNGDIPDGYEIHHRDFDRWNNDIDNLECLSNKDHKARHPKTHAQKEAFVKTRESLLEWQKTPEWKDHMDKARKKANLWHKSEEGKKWMLEHNQKIAANRKYRTITCKECGGKRETKAVKKVLFCSWQCGRKFRKKNGKQ